MSVIETHALCKKFGTTTALDNVSLHFGEGEFFGLLGPSGSGKTTLLRAIAGFITPDAGEIRFDGERVEHVPVHKRAIGMVFQNYALFPHMSVAENIAFGLTIRGLDPTDRVAEMLALVQLEGLGTRRPRELSGGQQQRVALARALITKPKVLLLDEPLGALDRRLRQEMQVELKTIQRKTGITAIFVTHDQEEALTLSDRIAIIHEGRLIQQGPPREVYENPTTLFAARFLGDANLLTARHAIIRPEKLALTPDPKSPHIVTQVIFSGPSVTYRIASADFVGGLALAFQQNVTGTPLTQGTHVALHWNNAHVVEVRP
jgi:ABC-type Fe3+/spermidine/putrescine transport system ATPase subunit